MISISLQYSYHSNNYLRASHPSSVPYRYADSYVQKPHTDHLVLIGIVDYELLYHATEELFWGGVAMNLKPQRMVQLVVMSSVEPTDRVKMLLVRFKGKLQYILGNAKKFADLHRAGVQQALAVIVVPDIACSSLKVEEDSVFLSSIALMKFLDFTHRSHGFDKRRRKSSRRKSSARIKANQGHEGENNDRNRTRPITIVKLTSSARNRPVLRAMGIDVVISLTELRYTLFAYGALFPGFVAVFMDLIGWKQPESEISDGINSSRGGGHKWGARGSSNSVHQISVADTHPSYRGMLYHKAVRVLVVDFRGLCLCIFSTIFNAGYRLCKV